MGPNFNSEREQAIAGPQGPRARRASILDSDMAPTEFLAAQVAQGGADGMAGGPPGRSRARTNSSLAPPVNGGGAGGGGGGSMANGANAAGSNQQQDPAEMQNARALEVLDRVAQKLTGRDFKPEEELDVISQVNKLIMDATRLENLCQHYIGWCSFW